MNRAIEIVKNLKSFSRVDLAEIGSININQSIEETIKILKTKEHENLEFTMELQNLPRLSCEVISINQCLFSTLQNAIEAVENNGIVKINPFFTTKSIGSIMGLGLTMVERVIKRHDGRINLKSKDGFGTTVTIELPVRDLQ